LSARGRINLHSSYLYPVLRPGTTEFVGGAEVQQAAIARGLAARGFDVSVATCDYGQGRRVEIDGVTVLATFPPHAGIPVLRFFHPRLTRTYRALLAADAEVYYARCSGLQPGLSHDVARWKRAAFVMAAAHDFDALRSLPLVTNPRDRWWYRRALRGASAVIAQTEHQRRLFREEFGVESVVVPNLVALPGAPADPARGALVVWLSTYKAAKRPEWMWELARRLPGLRFVMVGVLPPPPLTPEAWERAREAARVTPNLEVRGRIDHDRLGDLFREAALFVHTSPAEGFANTLLEAWAHGVPTVSAVDPGGIAAREGLGESAVDLEAMTEAVRRWMADPARRAAAGARARAYVAAHHAPDVVIDRLATVFDGLVGNVRARKARGPEGSTVHSGR
jgi:glycosyltransferase involved in cell wall biosynthesis